MKNIHKKLLQWYEKNERVNLPWRKTSNVYHIYISEIMLQQTSTQRVKQLYYPRFIERFPSLESLANANSDEILSLWSGLGYYQRAKNLHKCAKICARKGLPRKKSDLLKLPGIGEYTASAICSFAYNQPVSVVDTNIARVIKRYYALVKPKESCVRQKAQEFLNTSCPKNHNLALMDLGALICMSSSAQCDECPLKSTCKGKNTPYIYTQSKKTTYIKKELHLGVCIKNKKVALYPSKKRLYEGLLVLPDTNARKEFLDSFTHSYTKYRLHVRTYRLKRSKKEAHWVDINKLDYAPISSLTRKALQCI